ncbi:bifunctional metallophosphatase/5'-nucleotidase [Tessaracoccus antarcticus]|uniref:Bifunctional metallophosphatase/5'-nucleotidase n=1 Tax=Tessaracoccus antarcticus TaxID=2479848 RepID=A0A3M0G598_9ACTN|nr:5'-nucleotidase C-terminal domain-containing protein [Tessaracoccus antarcticus]RMB60210.1 bifunctional metallophosphatase/5'-nucleotidase [Tessaracoccus antarcticus]
MRRPLAGVAVAALTLAAMAGLTSPAHAEPDSIDLTLLGTTDVHGHVYNWDYFANAEYSKEADVLGLTRVSSYVNDVREEVGPESVVLMDSGDVIQGTPLTYYYGFGEGRRAVLSGEEEHPMAQAFRHIGYDTLGIGNHEFNYGLDMLKAYQRDLHTDEGGPALLGANVIDVATGEPWLEPYKIIERTIDGTTVKVGVIGLVTPGVRIWDKQNVDGILEFRDLVETAKEWVPIVAAQADVVVINAHSGKGDAPDDGYDEQALYENAINNVAHQVPGIDYILFGHTHRDDPETIITNVAGEKVLLTQPYYWARSITRTTVKLVQDTDGQGWMVDWSEGNAPHAVATYGYEISSEDQSLKDLLADKHQAAIDYVNRPVADSVAELKAETSRYEDTPIIDFINRVQTETVAAALGKDLGDATLVSIAAPFSRTAVFPKGKVSIRDIAGLYIYENTLMAVELTGAQLRDYLEYSAKYFNQVKEGATFDPEVGTNAGDEPDYNYDILSGLNYSIDISQPVGKRITGLTYPGGKPVGDGDAFVMALNNYRASGGGGFPHVADAKVVYNEQREIRQLLIEWASARGVIDPADFFVKNWGLITAPLPAEEPSTTPTPSPGTGPTPGLPHTGADGEVDAAVGIILMLVLLAGSRSVLARRPSL